MNVSEVLALLTTEKAIEIIIIISITKLIVNRFVPVIQESIQAIVCIVVGMLSSFFINESKNFIFIGIILGGIVFYGKDLFYALKVNKNNVENLKKELKEDIEKSFDNKE